METHAGPTLRTLGPTTTGSGTTNARGCPSTGSDGEHLVGLESAESTRFGPESLCLASLSNAWQTCNIHW